MKKGFKSYIPKNGGRVLPYLIAALSFIVLLPEAQPLRADITGFDLFLNTVYQQTSGAAPTTPLGYFANFDVFAANPGDFDGASVTYPGTASPQTLSPNLPFSNFGFGSPFIPGLSTFASAYPFGTYTYTATNSATLASQTVSLDYLQNAYTAGIPAFTAGTYAALQGMNTGQAFQFNFNSFTPDPSATGLTFLTIFGSPFSAGLTNSATSATMAANTLTPGTTYTYELDFSDRVTGSDNGVPYTIGFDIRTDGTFTTATPEPGYFALLGGGVLALLATVVRRRALSSQVLPCK